MSVDMWAYEPDICDGDFCPMDCDYCSKAYNREDNEELERFTGKGDKGDAYHDSDRDASGGRVVYTRR